MNRRSRDLKLQSLPEGHSEQDKVAFLQESNTVDPFGLFQANVAILYRGIYKKAAAAPNSKTFTPKDGALGDVNNNEPSPAYKKVGMIGIIYEIEYLRKLIDSSLEGCKYDPQTKKCDGIENTAAGRKTRYLLYDHN
jgi:hypothetical protein